jgi:hypothetical protein
MYAELAILKRKSGGVGRGHRPLVRAFLSALGIVLLSVSVTGCDPLVLADAPLAIRGKDGSFEVAVCRPAQVIGVLVESRSTGLGATWQRVWLASGELDVVAGETIGASEVPEGLTAETWGAPELTGSGTISITLTIPDGTLDALIKVPDTGIPEAKWLHDDGELSGSPCAPNGSD